MKISEINRPDIEAYSAEKFDNLVARGNIDQAYDYLESYVKYLPDYESRKNVSREIKNERHKAKLYYSKYNNPSISNEQKDATKWMGYMNGTYKYTDEERAQLLANPSSNLSKFNNTIKNLGNGKDYSQFLFKFEGTDEEGVSRFQNILDALGLDEYNAEEHGITISHGDNVSTLQIDRANDYLPRIFNAIYNNREEDSVLGGLLGKTYNYYTSVSLLDDNGKIVPINKNIVEREEDPITRQPIGRLKNKKVEASEANFGDILDVISPLEQAESVVKETNAGIANKEVEYSTTVMNYIDSTVIDIRRKTGKINSEEERNYMDTVYDLLNNSITGQAFGEIYASEGPDGIMRNLEPEERTELLGTLSRFLADSTRNRNIAFAESGGLYGIYITLPQEVDKDGKETSPARSIFISDINVFNNDIIDAMTNDSGVQATNTYEQLVAEKQTNYPITVNGREGYFVKPTNEQITFISKDRNYRTQLSKQEAIQVLNRSFMEDQIYRDVITRYGEDVLKFGDWNNNWDTSGTVENNIKTSIENLVSLGVSELSNIPVIDPSILFGVNGELDAAIEDKYSIQYQNISSAGILARLMRNNIYNKIWKNNSR